MKTVSITADEVRDQIQRVLESEYLRASELQRRLLKYLAEKSLSGEADQLKEYTIGVEALGRPDDYDPRHDSSVRIQVGKLRQKLLEYYLNDGRSDPVYIDFPKGRFKLIFSTHNGSGGASLDPGRLRWKTIAVGSIGVVVLLAVICLYMGMMLTRLQHPASAAAEMWSPELEELWAPFLDSRANTVICVGAPLFLRVAPGGRFFRDVRASEWEDAHKLGLIDELKQAFPGYNPQPWYPYTGVGEAGGVFLVSQLLATKGPKVSFATSSVLTWDHIGANNLVFIGPPKFNLKINDLPVALDFVMEDLGIRNLRPRPGEPAFYPEGTTDAQGNSGQTQSLISRLPGLRGKGEILVLAGNWTQGTLAAAQYMSSSVYARDLLDRIRLPSGQIPKYFQVIITSKYKNWTSIEISYVTHRVLGPEAADADSHAGTGR